MESQIRTIMLKCPSCGAALEVTPDLERFACGYCGIEQIVQRKGGTVALRLITEAIARVQTGTDRTAAELAIKRTSDEIELLNRKLSNLNFSRVVPALSVPLIPFGLIFGHMSKVAFGWPHAEAFGVIVAITGGMMACLAVWFTGSEGFKKDVREMEERRAELMGKLETYKLTVEP